MSVMSKLPVKVLIGILTVALAYASAQPVEKQTAFEEKAFIAGDQAKVEVYELGMHGEMQKAKSFPRGTKVTLGSEEPLKVNGETFRRIEPDGAEYRTEDAGSDSLGVLATGSRIRTGETDRFVPLYAKPSDLSRTWEGVVREKELFVRTPVTLYKNSKGPEIAGFAPKGTRLEVTGFAGLDKNGEAAMYKVRSGANPAEEGFAYRRYLVRSQEAAAAVYNENGEYDKAKKAKYDINLYGGSAAGLDYYPRPRQELGGKDFCRESRGMYLNSAAVLDYKPYVKIMKETNCNAVVIDIKDNVLSYKSPAVKKLSPTAYKKARTDVDTFRTDVGKIRSEVKQATGRDIYLIGRIACFNDRNYAKDHPEDCIETKVSDSRWPSAYSRDVWYYNVALAIEAVRLFGFDEIQFDYVRFPEAAYEMSLDKKTDFRNKYGESKVQAIQNFCIYAADQIHEAGAYFSVDVFGECADGYVTAYGQYWPAISNVADAISGMPYTDHFGEEDTWSEPKGIMKHWAKNAAKEQKKIPTPAAARTWITGYSTPFWAPQVKYDRKKLKEQVDALYTAGLNGGFIPWHSASSVKTYRSYKGIWDYEE